MLFPVSSPGFGRLTSNHLFGQSGDFVITVKVNDEAVSALPFSVREEKGTDPFNPTRRFPREGPWRDFGFLSVRVDDPDARVSFNWWASLRELPAGAARQGAGGGPVLPEG